MQVAYDRVDGPVMRDDKGVAGHLDKACLSQHPLVMIWPAARLVLGSNVAVCHLMARPAADGLRDQALPRSRAAPETIAAQDGHAAARLQPLQGVLGHQRLIEAVERFPDGDQGT